MDEEPATSDVIIDTTMWHSDARQDKEDLLKDGPASSGKDGELLWQGSCENNFFALDEGPLPLPAQLFYFLKKLLKT